MEIRHHDEEYLRAGAGSATIDDFATSIALLCEVKNFPYLFIEKSGLPGNVQCGRKVIGQLKRK
jgi:hypothetical protein